MSTGPQLPNNVGGWAIWVIGIIAIVAIVYVGANAMGIAIPAFVVTIFWILVAAVLLVAAIRFIMKLTGS